MENNQTNVVEVPRWLQAQNSQIERATSLIKEHGANVEFLVLKDRMFLDETITPLTNIDGAMDFLYRLEGRGIDAESIALFKEEYAGMVAKINSVESLAIELLSQTNVRVDNRNLGRKIQAFKKAEYSKKQASEKAKKEKKEDKAKKIA